MSISNTGKYTGSILMLFFLGCLVACGLETGTKTRTVPPHTTKPIAPDVAIMVDSLFGKEKTVSDVKGVTRYLDSLLQKYSYKDSLSYAMLLVSRGLFFNMEKTPDSVLKYMQEASYYFDHHPEYPKQRTLLYERMGKSYYFSGNQVSASYYMNKAGIELGGENGDTLFTDYKLSGLYKDIAGISRINQLYEQAQRYILLAITYGKNVKRQYPRRLLDAYMEAMPIFMESDKLDSARLFLDSINSYSKQFPNSNESTIILNHNAHYFYTVKNWDSALYYCRKTIQILEKEPDVSLADLGVEYYNIGDIYTWLRQLKPAAEYLKKSRALLLADSTLLLDDQLKLEENTLHYYIVSGQRDRAEQQLEVLTLANRNFYTQDRMRVINELEAQYHLKEKEKFIQQLDTENKLVADELGRKNLLLLVSILVILLAATIVILLAVLLRERRIHNEKEKVSLEQRLLRSQMEPHFIFNTLSVLQHIIRSDQKEKSIKYLRHFASLLRISLESSRASLVSLEDEVKALENYLSLQELRFEDKFNYVLEIYPGYEEDELMIPPMLLQPFVENAIEHGLRGIPGKGIVKIMIRKQEDVLECIIEDNGCGLNTRSTPHKDKRSLSTTITRERLAILGKKTGKTALVEVIDKQSDRTSQETGTIVRVLIPFQ
jgi:tetratricopeptide (TPR) repeat protein